MKLSGVIVLLITLFVVSACAPATPQFAIPPEDIIATNVAATIAALPTFTPAPTQSPQPTATKVRDIVTEAPTQQAMATLTPIPTLTPFVTITPTATKMGEGIQNNGPFSCKITEKDPKDKTKIAPAKGFMATWTVINLGQSTWDSKKMNVKYISGSRMQGNDNVLALPSDVPPQGTVKINVDMTTPKKEGEYTMTWGIFQGDQLACTLILTVKVGK